MIDHILEVSNKYQDKYNAILLEIQNYKHIAIFHHVRPDFDAFGCCEAMRQFILANFIDKDVILASDDEDNEGKKLFGKAVDNYDLSWFDQEFLAIIVDTPNISRVSIKGLINQEKINEIINIKASSIVKIDHHPADASISGINVVDESMAAASEIIANMFYFSKLKINDKCRRALFIGIAGDSGQFEYDSTSAHTFEVASRLMEGGLDIRQIYHDMFSKEKKYLDIYRFIYDTMKITDKGVAYYYFSNENLKKYGLSVNQSKNLIDVFKHIDSIKIWFCIAEDASNDNDPKKTVYRISLRSEYYPINKIATKYKGGGHPCAAGCRLYHLKHLDEFIKDLEDLIA